MLFGPARVRGTQGTTYCMASVGPKSATGVPGVTVVARCKVCGVVCVPRGFTTHQRLEGGTVDCPACSRRLPGLGDVDTVLLFEDCSWGVAGAKSMDTPAVCLQGIAQPGQQFVFGESGVAETGRVWTQGDSLGACACAPVHGQAPSAAGSACL